MKIHLGCGSNKIKGWVNIDSVEECHPDMVHDITQPLPFDDLSVDEVLAEDLLEHFDKYMRFIEFSDWCRVLKMDGRITLQVPNFKKILFKYFKFGFNNFGDFIFGENLWRSEYYLGHFGNHKWGYSEKSLCDFVALFGIEPVEVTKSGFNIRLVGAKKHNVPQREIDQIEIYSHANHCGDGEAKRTVGFVRSRVQEFQCQERGYSDSRNIHEGIHEKSR